MICPSCGYETFHPKAVNCDLCAAPLHPEKAASKGAAEAAGELEAMANLVAAAEAAPAESPTKAAKADKPKPEKKPATDSAVATIAPTFVAAAEATALSPLDLLLFVLALPVTFPVAVWGLLGASVRDIATWIWVAVGLTFVGVGALGVLTSGATAPLLYLPCALAASSLCGGLLLLRQGEPDPAKVVIGLSLVGGLLPLVLGPNPGQLARMFERSHAGIVQCIEVTRDGSAVISGASDAEVIVWTPANGLPRFRLSAHAKAIAATYAVGNDLLVTAGWDGAIYSWDLRTGEARTQYKTNLARGISALVVRPQGDQVVYASPLGAVTLSPLAQHEPVELGAHGSGVSALAITRKGDVAASAASDGSIIVWDLDVASAKFELPEAHAKSVRALAFTDDGRLISTSYDRTIKVWSDSGELLQTLQISSPVRAFAVRGKRAVSGHGDRTVSLWDVGEQLQRSGSFDLGEGKAPPAAVAFFVTSSVEAVLVGDDKDVRPILTSRFAQ